MNNNVIIIMQCVRPFIMILDHMKLLLRLCFRLQLPAELCSGRHPAADRSQDEQNNQDIRASHIYLFNPLFLSYSRRSVCRGDWKHKLSIVSGSRERN